MSEIDNNCKTLRGMHKRYIVGSANKAIVRDTTMFLCLLTQAVISGAAIDAKRSYVSTKVLKHLYDSKPAVVYDFILDHLHEIVKYPDHIFENKPGKRGSLCFVKTIRGNKLLATVEIVGDEKLGNELYVITAFPTKENYLKNCTLIWSWRGGDPSS